MRMVAVGMLAGLLAGCASQSQDVSTDLSLSRISAGEPQVSGGQLQRRIEAAATHPLGSRQNPVRAAMPPGQRAYLARLRCGNGQAPQFSRIGNYGVGVFGNIIDGYDVNCGDAAPGRVEIYMDMYHPGYEEARPVAGFTIMPAGQII